MFLALSVVSVFSACTTGEKMSGLEPGMTRQQVVGVLGRPDAVRSNGQYEQLEYTHRLVTGWSWDRSDSMLFSRTAGLSSSAMTKLEIEVPRSCTCTPTRRASRSSQFIHTSHSRSHRQSTSTYRLRIRPAVVYEPLRKLGVYTLADKSGNHGTCYDFTALLL